MTDNDIIKALEICGTYKGKCIDCPAYVKVDRSLCNNVILGALEIITRQKEEIEELKKPTSASAIFELSRQQERAVAEHSKYVAEIGAAAIKAFAERLKVVGIKVTGGRGFEGVFVMATNLQIDDLVKEMVGDEE